MRCMSSAEAQGIDRLLELELSISQAKTLFVLAQSTDPLPIHAVAEHIRLSVAATGRNIDSLVKMGLVERREDATDRRVKLVRVDARSPLTRRRGATSWSGGWRGRARCRRG